MSDMQFTFTAIAESDLLDGPIGPNHSFTQPDSPTISITVTDNDDRLSGDFFELSLDRSGQTAEIIENGVEIGNGGKIYAERALYLSDENGRHYTLVEIEQEGSGADYFSYIGRVPPAGATLFVQYITNVSGRGISYDDLGAGDPPPNIVDIATGSDDFNLLVKALSTAGLVGTVQAATDITVFAPTDAAFAQLAVDLGFEGDTSDEDAVFDAIVAALTDLSPDNDPVPLLTDVLLYHVSPGAKSADEIDAADAVATLLTGATFGTEGTVLIDNEPDVENPDIVVPDIAASNGIVQVIDRVLLPLDIPGNTPPEPELPTLTAIVAASGGVFDDNNADFDILLNAVQAAGLAGALDDPEADLTVFAPEDAAFIGLAQALGFDGADEAGAFSYIVEALTLLSAGEDPIPLLTDILLYHVAPVPLTSGEVLSATSIDTLLGVPLGVDGTALVDQDPDVPNPELIEIDIPALNGIAHIIDGVLLPVDVLQSDGSNKVDFLIGSDANETFFTGRDDDYVSGLGGRDTINLGKGDDVALGGDGNDFIRGMSGDDTIHGGDGNDSVRGGRGEDIVKGGAGRDFVFGGRDHDILEGGSGADTFFFNHMSDTDVVTDFAIGEDLIRIRLSGHDSFDDVEDVISDTAEGALIDLGSVQVTLEGVRAISLSEDDFIFG